MRRTWLVLFFFVLGCSAGSEPTADGRAAFANACGRCHGEHGTGGVPAQDGGPAPRNFTDPGFQASHTDTQIRDVIVNGKGTAMPAFGATFDADQLGTIVAVVRSFDPAKKHP